MTVETLCEQLALPSAYLEQIPTHIHPVADAIASHGGIIAIAGPQGCGKSTLAQVLEVLLTEKGMNVARLSIDDFYLDPARRARLAKEIHPLLATRGVPGTHDLDLMRTVLTALQAGDDINLPRFDKASDKAKPASAWPCFEGNADIVLFEGWCVNAIPEPGSRLEAGINPLEWHHDAEGVWRNWVNKQLQDYQSVFALAEQFIFFRIPSFDCVARWRGLQEQKLAAKNSGAGVMDNATLMTFIQHFERITRWMQEEAAERADYVLNLDAQHRFI